MEIYNYMYTYHINIKFVNNYEYYVPITVSL